MLTPRQDNLTILYIQQLQPHGSVFMFVSNTCLNIFTYSRVRLVMGMERLVCLSWLLNIACVSLSNSYKLVVSLILRSCNSMRFWAYGFRFNGYTWKMFKPIGGLGVNFYNQQSVVVHYKLGKTIRHLTFILSVL